MANRTKRSDKERFRYGICLNDECEMCKGKTVQKVPMRKEFVCSVCEKELRECPPPRKKSKLPFIIISAILVLAAIILSVIFFSTGSTEPSDSKADTLAIVDSAKSPTTDVTKTDTVILRDTIVKNNTITTSEKISTKTVVSTTTPAQTKTSSSNNGIIRLSYGTYSGSIKGGYPHGQGRLTYSTTRIINRNDPKGRTASSGDYVIGEFFNGFLVYGKHYDAAGTLLESLNIGVGNESSYESK